MASNEDLASMWDTHIAHDVLSRVNMPTVLTTVATPEQVEAYALMFRIKEITARLEMDDFTPATVPDYRRRGRSPSPEPRYDASGKRTNTREQRYKEALDKERYELIDKVLRIVPNYKTPSDYRRIQKTSEKVYIPTADFPEINFLGLIFGPRGNTLKSMEKESGARIAIRGAGSVKAGRGNINPSQQQTMDEDLHCVVSGDSEEKIRKGIQLINNIIETAASIPETENTFKKDQLRQLAVLNGTFRETVEDEVCPVCHEKGHKRYNCPNRAKVTATLLCHICGEPGHFARDCLERKSRPRGRFQDSPHTSSEVDRDYHNLMKELGGERSGEFHSGDAGYNATRPPPPSGPMLAIEGGSIPLSSEQPNESQHFSSQNQNHRRGYDNKYRERDQWRNRNDRHQPYARNDRSDNRYNKYSRPESRYHDRYGGSSGGGWHDRDESKFRNHYTNRDAKSHTAEAEGRAEIPSPIPPTFSPTVPSTLPAPNGGVPPGLSASSVVPPPPSLKAVPPPPPGLNKAVSPPPPPGLTNIGSHPPPPGLANTGNPPPPPPGLAKSGSPPPPPGM